MIWFISPLYSILLPCPCEVLKLTNRLLSTLDLKKGMWPCKLIPCIIETTGALRIITSENGNINGFIWILWVLNPSFNLMRPLGIFPKSQPSFKAQKWSNNDIYSPVKPGKIPNSVINGDKLKGCQSGHNRDRCYMLSKLWEFEFHGIFQRKVINGNWERRKSAWLLCCDEEESNPWLGCTIVCGLKKCDTHLITTSKE